jgi:hypothetical protein
VQYRTHYGTRYAKSIKNQAVSPQPSVSVLNALAKTFGLLDRYATGEQGAFALADAAGDRFVLKWAPDCSVLTRYQRAQHITERLRPLGYPAPQYVLVGCSADAAYAIQRTLPGQPMEQLPLALVADFLTLNERQAGQVRLEAPTWPEPVVNPVLFGGGGFCLLEPMQTYSTTTARMLPAVQAIVRRYADQLAPRADIVHFDCNPANILATATRITGVIDWDGWCAGDRMFDVATMLFYSYAAPDSLLEIYFKHRWYNVWHICEQTSNINQIYCNLSMPAVRTASGIEWVDLDLDYRVHLDGRLECLDEDEYRAHIASMGYSVEVQAHLHAACAEIEALYHQRADPFNHVEQVALYQQIKAMAGTSHAATARQRR